MSSPKNSCQTLLRPPNQPIRAPIRQKMTPKLNIEIDENIENESCSTTWVDPNTVFEPFPDPPKTACDGPKKYKMTLKLSQIKMSELKET